MTPGGNGIDRFRRGGRLLPALALAALMAAAITAPAAAQMFSDRPPPVPPASASIPPLPAPLAQPSVAAVPPVVAPQGAAVPGQAVLALTARYGKDLPVISSGLVWRGVSDRPGETGTLKFIREDSGAPPKIL